MVSPLAFMECASQIMNLRSSMVISLKAITISMQKVTEKIFTPLCHLPFNIKCISESDANILSAASMPSNIINASSIRTLFNMHMVFCPAVMASQSTPL